MGGAAFKGPDGEPLTTEIMLEEVRPTLASLLRDVLKPVGIDAFVPLGSTGKKARSGDLDIAVGPIPMDDPKAAKAIKDALLSNIKSIVGPDRAMLLGQNIAIMVPIAGSPDRFVQVDMMLSGNPNLTGWLMSGVGEGVKGVYRNLMLAYLASVKSKESGGATKITISFPGGIQVTQDGVVTVKRTEDPETIISVLGIPASPSEITRFEDLISILINDPVFSRYLPGFEDYIARYLNDPNPKVAGEAQAAISALKNAKGLREAIRRVLYSIR